MPLSNSHSPFSGDSVFFSRSSLASGLILVSMLALYTAMNLSSHFSSPAVVSHDTAIASAEKEFDLKGIDLFTMANLGQTAQQDNKTLYRLSPVDRILYNRVFKAQEQGDWAQARALLKRVHDPILTGHVLYDRYMAEGYEASYAELRDWMVRYGDQPQAYKIYQLAQKRRNNDPSALPAPQMAKKLLGSIELSWFSKTGDHPKASPKPLKRDETQIADMTDQIKTHLANDRVTAAYDLLGGSKVSRMLSAVEYDSLMGEIAAGYYYNGKYGTALHVAEQATARSGPAVPVAHWIAGLSAWQKDEYKKSAEHFKAISESHSHNPWMLSAGSFWAARAYAKMGETDKYTEALQQAAAYPRTFYGLIAKAKLGKHEPFSWAEPELTPQMIAAIKATPSGRRALALLDVDQNNLAQQELLQIHPNGDKNLEQALVAMASHFKLPRLAMRLGNAVNQPDGSLYDVALYPIVPWKGDVSVNVDPALINALIRQESQFDINAINDRSGAKGLMQLMPSTAQLVSDDSFDAKDLHKPDVNVALGQRYVHYLLNTDVVDGNLIYLAAAYNAGPGNLIAWKKAVNHKDDPLLFIESLPYSETRAFVERVMTNYWIYSQRMTQESATLDTLRDGKWPIYKLPDDGVKVAASF